MYQQMWVVLEWGCGVGNGGVVNDGLEVKILQFPCARFPQAAGRCAAVASSPRDSVDTKKALSKQLLALFRSAQPAPTVFVDHTR